MEPGLKKMLNKQLIENSNNKRVVVFRYGTEPAERESIGQVQVSEPIEQVQVVQPMECPHG